MSGFRYPNPFLVLISSASGLFGAGRSGDVGSGSGFRAARHIPESNASGWCRASAAGCTGSRSLIHIQNRSDHNYSRNIHIPRKNYREDHEQKPALEPRRKGRWSKLREKPSGVKLHET